MDEIIKDQKQMINYLHKQAEDHVKLRDTLIEMNEQLEKELIEKDENIMKLKKKLNEKKCKESNDVEKLINEIELTKKSNTEKEKSLVEFENVMKC